MIKLTSVSFTYPGADRHTLRQIDLAVEAGSLALLIGPTGSGKTTLLATLNGLVPRFSGGLLTGSVIVDGYDTSEHDIRSMATKVGMVRQSPERGFVTETVEEELAYSMEQVGIEPSVMRRRVEETLDLMGLADLRSRPLHTLSGGEAQRVAIGSVLTAHPPVMVLDEPTSALDPGAAEEVLAAVTRLVHDLGVTVLMAEHRLERVVQYADQISELDTDGRVRSGEPAAVLQTAEVAPPIVELGRLVGWSPVPVSVRDGRRRAAGLKSRLDEPEPVSPPVTATRLEVSGLSVRYGRTVAVDRVDLEVHAGEVVALMGRNGSGKSSLLWAIQGSGVRTGGQVAIDGTDPADLSPPERRRLVGLVPDHPADLFFMESVADECRRADAALGVADGTCLSSLRRLIGPIEPTTHPSDLSEGQQLALALAIQLAGEPALVLLDEPTRGFDYASKRRLADAIGRLAAAGTAVVISTHDVEFVAVASSRVLIMAEGEIVADGATPEVVVSSPIYAPQVAKVLGPGPWLTVGDVSRTLRPA